MPINKSSTRPFFKFLVFSLVIALHNSTFILYKGPSESLAKSKLTSPDYIFFSLIGIDPMQG